MNKGKSTHSLVDPDTHSLYEIPDGKLLPVVIVENQHPLTTSRLNESLFVFDYHIDVAKWLLRELPRFIEDAKKGKDKYLSCFLSGTIYLPKT